MIHTQFLSALFHITHIPDLTQLLSSSPISNDTTPPAIVAILSRFQDLFIEPLSLPTHHSITHHIHLLPNSNLVNVKPYRYPHSQKVELKKQVSSMLDVGLIQLGKDLSLHQCY